MFSRLIITLKKKKNFQLWFVFEKEKHATLKWQPKLSQQRRSQFFYKQPTRAIFFTIFTIQVDSTYRFIRLWPKIIF